MTKYNDDTLMPFGPHKHTALCRVEAAYLLDLYREGTHDQLLVEYIKENLQMIKDRRDGKIQPPPLKTCDKIIYPTKKIADQELRKIRSQISNDYKPTRSYECTKCGGWHLTSIVFEAWEKMHDVNDDVPGKPLTLELFKTCMTMVPHSKLITIGQKVGHSRKFSVMFADFVSALATSVWNNKTLVRSIIEENPHIFSGYYLVDERIMSDGFFINFHGDHSVGIFSQEWRLKGNFEFENKEELEQFRAKLLQAWEHVSDTPVTVQMFEERAREERKIVNNFINQ